MRAGLDHFRGPRYRLRRQYQWGLKMFCRKTLVASVISILAATSVSAATYTFDLQNLNSDNPTPGDPGTLTGNELVIEQSGLTGTFTGFYIDNAVYTGDTLTGGTISPAHSVERWYNGLGVCNDGACYGDDPLHTVDGVTENRTDYVQMAFSDESGAVDVTLKSLVFGWIGDFRYGYEGTNGSFEILLDDFGLDGIGLGDSRVFSGIATPSLNFTLGRGLYDLAAASGLFGDTFAIKAGELGSWKLLSVVVDWTAAPPPPPPPPPIPLPAAGWLLLGGLAGLAALRRRA